MKMSIDAVKLRLVLLVAMVLIVVVSIGVFQFAYSQLKNTAKDVSAKAAEAAASQNEIERLQQVQRKLEENKDIANKVAGIVAESKSYKYQNQIVNDLNDFANRSGIKITGIDFTQQDSASQASGSSSSEGAGAATASPEAGAADLSGGSGATADPSATPTSSLKTITATITIESPLNYTSFLRFINSIEQNLTKMQIQNLSLVSSDGLSSESLTIEVYTR